MGHGVALYYQSGVACQNGFDGGWKSLERSSGKLRHLGRGQLGYHFELQPEQELRKSNDLHLQNVVSFASCMLQVWQCRPLCRSLHIVRETVLQLQATRS